MYRDPSLFPSLRVKVRYPCSWLGLVPPEIVLPWWWMEVWRFRPQTSRLKLRNTSTAPQTSYGSLFGGTNVTLERVDSGLYGIWM
ncbi:hypothetical protein Mapa_006524 [Marchantia paleacea]|nr:hypothetical protein Mapa_006524 [Marchantia paleacea]